MKIEVPCKKCGRIITLYTVWVKDGANPGSVVVICKDCMGEDGVEDTR